MRIGLGIGIGVLSALPPPPAAPTLTAPAAGDVYPGVPTTVSATAPDTNLDRIDFVLDPGGSEVVIATDSSSPYSQSWTPAQTVGTHTLVARAWRMGMSTDSTPISVRIFDPTLITGLDQWLRGDSATLSGSDVTTMLDKSGLGHDVTISAGTKATQVTPVDGNGRLAFRFAGTEGNYSSAPVDWTGVTQCSVFVVYKKTAAGAADIASKGVLSSSSGATVGLDYVAGATVIGAAQGANYNERRTTATTFTVGPYVFSATVDTTQNAAGEDAIWMNGASQGLTIVGPNTDLTDIAGNNKYYVGQNGLAGNPFAGDCYEVIWFKTLLSNADRVAVENLLRAYYATG